MQTLNQEKINLLIKYLGIPDIFLEAGIYFYGKSFHNWYIMQATSSQDISNKTMKMCNIDPVYLLLYEIFYQEFDGKFVSPQTEKAIYVGRLRNYVLIAT